MQGNSAYFTEVSMTITTNPTFDFELNISNPQGVLSHPDTIRVEFTPDVIASIARAQAALHAMEVGFVTEVVFDFHDNCPLFEEGESWIQEEKEPGAGDFDPSSFWLMVQSDIIGIKVWDEHDEAALEGDELIANIPGLPEALENAKADAYAALRARLA
jgi:hypothetical protein